MGLGRALEVSPAQLVEAMASPSPPCVVDVREDWEVEMCPFPGARHIRLAELPERGPAELPADVPVVLVCHHGVRSLQAALVLRGAGFSNAVSLAGGTDRWAREVDRAMPRY